ncbi:MAG: acetamidase/formamidase family protein [Chloroflexi bacterium]|nr:acetamidase/formamidase family protein [Chloroflexota bacterium]
MQKITRDKALKYEFNWRDKPLLHVKQGETFAVETWDAGSGLIESTADYTKLRKSPEWNSEPIKGNPIAGPIFVEGAEKGDLLEITLETIEPIEYGWTLYDKDIGPLGDSSHWHELNKGTVHIIKHEPGPSGTTRDGRGILNDRHSWPLAPMMGTIGCAPEREVETSAVGQGPWGGNLDIRDVKEGTKVLVNVYHTGGLLYIGDGHGSQGDTEYYGAADETAVTLTASCRVIKNKKIPFMRLVKPESIVSVYSYRPLETAVHSAVQDLMQWLVDDYGFTQQEAYIHTCVNPDFRINVYQMVRLGRLQFTVGAEIPKKYLS